MTSTRSTAPDSHAAPCASVVIPTHGRLRSLLRVLRALDRQQPAGATFEVLVVCDGDVDGSAEACAAMASSVSYPLRVLSQQNQGPAVARNTGIAAAHGDLIIFLDDDVVPDTGFIAVHVAAHCDRETVVAIGPLLPPDDMSLSVWCAWEERTLCEQYAAMQAGRWNPSYRQFYTGNASVRRGFLAKAGGFDAAFRRAEDVELALRLRDFGAYFTFLPDAVAWHYVQRSFVAWLRVPGSYGAADVAMARAGHGNVLRIVAEEFTYRHAAVKAATVLLAGRPRAMRPLVALFGGIIRGADWLGWQMPGSKACGFLANICYYHGLAEGLGGRDALRRLLRGTSIGELMPER